MSTSKKIYPKPDTTSLPEMEEGSDIAMCDIYKELIHLKTCLSGARKRIFNNKTLSEYLAVSTRTLQNWRDEGKISFTQVKEVILYSEEDVDAFMKKHRKVAFR